MPKTFAEASPPPHSPWGTPHNGPAEGWDRIAAGIHQCCTDSHGGLWLSAERIEAMPAELRALNFLGADSPFYEEDCSWGLVVEAFPDCFNEGEREFAKKCVQWTREWRASKARERVTGIAA